MNWEFIAVLSQFILLKTLIEDEEDAEKNKEDTAETLGGTFTVQHGVHMWDGMTWGSQLRILISIEFFVAAKSEKSAIAKVFAKVFAQIRQKNSISHIARTPWHVWEVEGYALLKFQPPTTPGDPQNVKKNIRKNLIFGTS